MQCYCTSDKDFLLCCSAFLAGTAQPQTPEELMRSRYTAFVLKDISYIEKTMKGKALQRADLQKTQAWLNQVVWKNLNVIKAEILTPTEGIVHFTAHYEENGMPQTLEEISEFKKIGSQWYYVKGKHPQSNLNSPTVKIGRNDPCSCQSGKKYKHCCALKS